MDINKEFDKKFTRVNRSNGKFEDRWFVKDTTTPKEIKQFYNQKIEELIEEIKIRIHKKYYSGISEKEILELIK